MYLTAPLRHRLFVLLGALMLCAQAVAADVRVMISAGFFGVYAELGPAFERATGHTVKIDFQNISKTRTRINNGDAFDIAVVSPKAVNDLQEQM
mgnify:CR=1 FL=1